MNKELRINASASIIEGEEADVLEVKPGTGVIVLEFVTDNPKVNDLGDEQYYVGDIEVYADGTIEEACLDKRYLNDINELYKKLHGDDNTRVIEYGDGLMMPVISKEKDQTRFTRVKDFLKEAGIELVYGEDKAIEAEEDYRNGIVRM